MDLLPSSCGQVANPLLLSEVITLSLSMPQAFCRLDYLMSNLLSNWLTNLWIHYFKSKFTFHDATPQQNAFHSCSYACGLTTVIPNRKASSLILHPKALPSVMEWPSNVNFKVSGKILKKPAEWNITPTKAAPHADFDFDTLSPVKKFKFNK